MRFGFGLALLLSVSATTAQADIRVWETGADPDGDPRLHRYLDITGFVQPGFILRIEKQPDVPSASGPGLAEIVPGDDRFLLQRARLGLRSRIAWWLEARLELELTSPGNEGRWQPGLADAYLEFAPHELLQIRLGQFQVPFLRAFQFHELDLGFIDRPNYTGSYALSARDLGVMIRGEVGDTSPGAATPVFEYQLAMFTGGQENSFENRDGAFLLAARLELHLTGRPQGGAEESDLARNTRPRVALAASGYSNCFHGWNRGWNVDAEFRWQGLYVSTAFLWLKNSPGRETGFGAALGYDDQCRSLMLGPSLETEKVFVSRAAHLQVQYVLPELLFPIRNQALEMLARADWFDPNSPYNSDNPILGSGSSAPSYRPPAGFFEFANRPTQLRLTFGLNWFPTGTQSLRVQLNYQHVIELEDVMVGTESVGTVLNDVLWLQVGVGL